MTNGASILHVCLQEGQYATKYSNVFDLKTGDIYLYQFHQHIDSVQLNLAVELSKGGHYLDMFRIHQQQSQAVLPLLSNMRRFFLADFPPISDLKPNVTRHLRQVMEDAMLGKMHGEDYSPELWSSISPIQKEVQEDLKRYGSFKSMTLVDCRDEGNKHINRYRLEFENVFLLTRLEMDHKYKILQFKSECAERKPGADLGE